MTDTANSFSRAFQFPAPVTYISGLMPQTSRCSSTETVTLQYFLQVSDTENGNECTQTADNVRQM